MRMMLWISVGGRTPKKAKDCHHYLERAAAARGRLVTGNGKAGNIQVAAEIVLIIVRVGTMIQRILDKSVT
jgi:hypothetical protein